MGDLADDYDAMVERAMADEYYKAAEYYKFPIVDFVELMFDWNSTCKNPIIANMLSYYALKGTLTEKQKRYAARIMAEGAI